MPKPNLSSAIKIIDQKGVLIVFTIKTNLEVPSLWNAFYPKSKMRWEWDDSGDDRVAQLWHLREQIFSSNRVAYAKWFQKRATFFSKKIFTDFLRVLNHFPDPKVGLSCQAQNILLALEENSPLSTKQLKAVVGLKGQSQEADYTRALSELGSRLLVVGCGEVDDGAFPSLAIGATSRIFEAEWKKASTQDFQSALANIQNALGDASPFYRYLISLRRCIFSTSRSKAKNLSRSIQKSKKRNWISLEDLSGK